MKKNENFPKNLVKVKNIQIVKLKVKKLKNRKNRFQVKMKVKVKMKMKNPENRSEKMMKKLQGNL